MKRITFEEKYVNQALKMAQIKAFKMVGEEGFEPSRALYLPFALVRNPLQDGVLIQAVCK
jgi:hypothetical protein